MFSTFVRIVFFIPGIAPLLLMAMLSTPGGLQTMAAENSWDAELKLGIWTRVHRMRPDDAVVFPIQNHGGSAFDTRRSRILLFGSDTHGEDWSNSPLVFDLATLAWRRVYPDDPPASYGVDARGLPVAGPQGDHPWAMHSFGAVDYDSARDAVLVSSHPAHMEPGRFSDTLRDLWPGISRHPNWLFDLKRERWSPLPKAKRSFFAYATTYDSVRGVMVGTGYDGVFELSEPTGRWEKKADGETIGYHNNAVYDQNQEAVVIFGRNGLGNDVLIYRTGEGEVVPMPTPGTRPPKDEHAPMAFHPKLAETIVLVDRFATGTSRRNLLKGRAETWAYDLGNDRWRRFETATLPFALGMNYHLHYDPQRNVLLLVTAAPPADITDARRLPEVWALRL
ncbi:hypothetical protein [Pelagibius sp. Alg239-R121]|uniref:hypothetical protein n=1 Tax=Pelagibius sp. Alg239-R121 TaxID=2993448 RepID=UPI0024A61DF9|nr:hypothetical protein [Pelagibius sp. Alg239-R121]